MGSIFQDLYDSEINFSVSCFWDSGWDVKLGDSLNGFKAETTIFDDWHDVKKWLRESACQHYPDSDFARKYQ